MSDNRRYYGGTGDPYSRQGRGLGTGRFKLFLIIGLAMAAFQAFKFYTSTQTNPITGEEQSTMEYRRRNTRACKLLLKWLRNMVAFTLINGPRIG
jgi:hypothetical protein